MKTRSAGNLRTKARSAKPGAPLRRPARPDGEERHALSTATAVAAETLRTGIFPLPVMRHVDEIPHEDETILAGDPDDDVLENEYGGENVPGGSAPSPDQNLVDEIGRAYGLGEEGDGPLHAASEIMERRDRHRSELRAPRRPRG